MLSKNQVKYLKRLGNTITSRYSIGKNGVHENFIELLDKGIRANELIKVNLLSASIDEVKEVSLDVANKLNAEIVSRVGHTILLYRRNEKNPRIVLPRD